jgi:hypothetical protein
MGDADTFESAGNRPSSYGREGENIKPELPQFDTYQTAFLPYDCPLQSFRRCNYSVRSQE